MVASPTPFSVFSESVQMAQYRNQQIKKATAKTVAIKCLIPLEFGSLELLSTQTEQITRFIVATRKLS